MLETTRQWINAGWGAAGAAVVVAIAIHLFALRVRRALRSRALAGRSPGPLSMAGRPLAARIVTTLAATASLLVTLGSVVAWIAAALLVTEQFSVLMLARDSALWLVATSITAPVFRIAERTFSIAEIAELPVLLGGVWVAVGIATRVIEARIARSRGVAAPGSGFVLRYVLTFVVGLVALQAWGIDVSSLALLASVLGVGVGFGLQGLVNNFVSGIVITVERPVRPGDYIRIGDVVGTVERIGARSTQIRTRDNVAIVVPNAHLLESEVVNWTLGDPRSRIHIPVSVAYGTDLRVARAALLEAAREHPDVLGEPAAEVDMNGFGESSLDLELEVWTADPRRQEELSSDLYYRIERQLRRYGISVPFPQREIHIRAADVAGLAAETASLATAS